MKTRFTLCCLLFSLFYFNSCKKDNNSMSGPVNCTNSDIELQIIDELNSGYAHPLADAHPDTIDPGLDLLIDFLGDTPLVGLGEATHGTADFYQMKDKIFRALVQQKNFKSIIFELPWGNAWVINEFVTKGIGTANSTVNQGGYWTYDTKEVRELAQWIHDYNLSLPDEEKIYFVGCDPQGSNFDVERDMISSYLQTVQPDSVIELFKNYNHLPKSDLSNYKRESDSIKTLNIIGTKKVYEHFVRNRDLFIDASSELEYEIALMAAHVIQHREYIYRIGNSGVPRDSLMAIYSEWWQRILGDQAKVAIWAHNLHVMDAAVINADWMGTYLRQRHGEDYKNVAFSFTTGTFNAFQANINRSSVGPVTRQSIPEKVCQTTNQLLGEVDGEQHYIIFEELDGESRQYFLAAQPFYQLGAGFALSYLEQNYTAPRRLMRKYDVLIHFDKTRAAIIQ